MWKTWLLRSATLAVVAILAGAWAVTLIGNDPAPASVNRHESPAQQRVRIHDQAPVAPERSHHRGKHGAKPSDESSDGISNVADTPADEGSATPSDPDTSTPDEPSSSPTHSPSQHPTPTPTPTPTEPSPTCTDLGGVIDCVLDPITDRP
jgi:cytoskeletal protein RodZ